MTEDDRKNHYGALKSLLEAKKSKGYEVKNVEDNGDVMGNLLGCQFDSDQRGGYVYFWSSGLVGYQLLDYDTGEEIIEDSTEKLDSPAIVKLLANLEANL